MPEPIAAQGQRSDGRADEGPTEDKREWKADSDQDHEELLHPFGGVKNRQNRAADFTSPDATTP